MPASGGAFFLSAVIPPPADRRGDLSVLELLATTSACTEIAGRVARSSRPTRISHRAARFSNFPLYWARISANNGHQEPQWSVREVCASTSNDQVVRWFAFQLPSGFETLEMVTSLTTKLRFAHSVADFDIAVETPRCRLQSTSTAVTVQGRGGR